MKGIVLLAAMLAALVMGSGCITPGDAVYCTPESRLVEGCYTLYEPVCGYSSMIEYRTYSNDCVACIDQDVQYHTPGECLGGLI